MHPHPFNSVRLSYRRHDQARNRLQARPPAPYTPAPTHPLHEIILIPAALVPIPPIRHPPLPYRLIAPAILIAPPPQLLLLPPLLHDPILLLLSRHFLLVQTFALLGEMGITSRLQVVGGGFETRFGQAVDGGVEAGGEEEFADAFGVVETDLAGAHGGGFAEVGVGGVEDGDVVFFVACVGKGGLGDWIGG